MLLQMPFEAVLILAHLLSFLERKASEISSVHFLLNENSCFNKFGQLDSSKNAQKWCTCWAASMKCRSTEKQQGRNIKQDKEIWRSVLYIHLFFLTLLCVSTEFPPGAHRHPDDGVHSGDGERGEGDVLHQQVLLGRTLTQWRTHPGAALRHRGCNHHLD